MASAASNRMLAVEAELKPEPKGTWGVDMAYLLLMPLTGSAMAQHFGTRDFRKMFAC
jgi:hypothetical protein